VRTGRKNDEMREVRVTKNYIMHPEGSVLIEFGNTKVICNATVEEKIPPFLRGSGTGWITAEYSMLPRATNNRVQREASKGKVAGRTMEIQRLIGRALRSSIDLSKLGERTIIIDCDVIQADGGTRTASITGAYLAMELAIEKLIDDGKLNEIPIISKVAAISVGKIKNDILLDLEYEEDSKADVDMNIIMNDKGEFIEIQGTGEEATFTQDDLMKFIAVSKNAFEKLFEFYNAMNSSNFKELILNYFEKNFKLLPEAIQESVCSKELNAINLTNQYLTNLKESLFVSYRETKEVKDKSFEPIEFAKILEDNNILKKVEEIILNFFKENQLKPANYTHTRISDSILELLKKNSIEMTQCFENYWELHYQLQKISKVIYSPFNSNLDLIRLSQYDSELIKKVEEELKNSNSTTTKQIKEDVEAILKMKTLNLPKEIVNHLRFVLSMPISF